MLSAVGGALGAVVAAVVGALLGAYLQRRHDVRQANDEARRQRKRVLQRLLNVETALSAIRGGTDPFASKVVNDEVYLLGEDNQKYVDAVTSPLVASSADDPIIQRLRRAVIDHDLTQIPPAIKLLGLELYGDGYQAPSDGTTSAP